MPTIPRAKLALEAFLPNSGGFRFTEDLADAPKLSIEGPSTYCVAAPQPIRIGEIEPTELTALPSIIEGAHYPIHRGYERDEFVKSAASWITALSKLSLDYEGEFHAHCNLFRRYQLRQYRKLIKRIKQLADALREMVALLQARSKYADLPEDCVYLRTILGDWLERATRAFEVLNLSGPRAWRPSCFGVVNLEISSEIKELAFDLKYGPLYGVGEIVKELEKERDGRT